MHLEWKNNEVVGYGNWRILVLCFSPLIVPPSTSPHTVAITVGVVIGILVAILLALVIINGSIFLYMKHRKTGEFSVYIQ